MVINGKDQRFTPEGDKRERASLIPSHLFRHPDIFQAVGSSPVIGKKELTNTLHYIHFSNGSLLVHVSDPEYGEDFLMSAELESCSPEAIFCRWSAANGPLPQNALLKHLIMSDGLSLLLFPIRVIDIRGDGFSTALPEKGHLLGKRRARRHAGPAIGVDLMQNGILARGELIDFSPLAFRVRLAAAASPSFIWMNRDTPFTMTLHERQRILFSGTCRCLRQAEGAHDRELVLEPQGNEIRRFRKQKTRNPRLKLCPSPSLHFEHPLSRKKIQREVRDMTFAGFSVEEMSEESVLIPGMMIPDLEIRHLGEVRIHCDAQVIYRRESGKGRIRCGLAILDMDFKSYRRLSHIMVHTGDPYARFTCEMAMEELWRFFFDTGFIYPHKYHQIKATREDFKETYRKLYQEDQDIEAHFTCQRDGRIYGHVSIFRAYQNAWMVHHLAAKRMKNRQAGLFVLRNILQFFDGLYRYPSVRMNYMLFYFRPENYFPNLFFGGFAREYRNPKGCSLDLFAYQNLYKEAGPRPLPAGWELAEFTPDHLPDLERFYRNASGGLLLDALGFDRREDGQESIEDAYRRHGFLRRCSLLALTREHALKAAIIVNRSDIGLNLSELINGIKVIVTDPAAVPREVLTAALGPLLPEYGGEMVPLMIYPADYPAGQGMTPDKKYLLWILDARHGKEYVEYMKKKARINPLLLIRHFLRKWLNKGKMNHDR